ncbi:hypothetical protein BCAR13_820017 [Paraburkholderia caribensis]|nr:hypothetical protein BCAR13_820017 [Paraburkholderia caribensis]
MSHIMISLRLAFCRGTAAKIMEHFMRRHLPSFERLAFSVVTASAVICAAILLAHRYGGFESAGLTWTSNLCFERTLMCQDPVASDGSGCGSAVNTNAECPFAVW